MYKVLTVGLVMTLVLSVGGVISNVYPLAFVAALLLLSVVNIVKYALADAACRTIGITLADFKRMTPQEQSIAVATIQHKQRVEALKRRVRKTY